MEHGARATRARTAVVGAIAVLLIASVVAVAVSSEEPRPATLSTIGPAHTGPGPQEVAVQVDEPTPTALSSAAAPPASAAPRPRPRPSSPAGPPSPAPVRAVGGAGTGTVLTFAAPGIYAVDVQSGRVQRLGNPAPFDVAGDTLLTAAGTTIWATPVTGGDSVVRYTLSGGDHIDWLEVAADGTAAVRLSTPRRGPDGYISGYEVKLYLVGPDGDVRSSDIGANEVEWAGDNSALALFNYQGVRAIRRDGSTAWGPIAAPESILTDLRVSHRGDQVTGQFDAHRVRRLDVAAAKWHDVPALWRDVSFSPDGRLLGQSAPPPGWNGRTALPVVTWNPADGSTSGYAPTGSEPSWSPDAAYAVLLDRPLSGPDNGTNYSFRIRGRNGEALFALTAPGRTFGRDDNRNSLGPHVEGPQWAAGGRYLVVGVS